MAIVTGTAITAGGGVIHLNHFSEDELLVSAKYEDATVFFSVESICLEFFGGYRERDELIQEYADHLAANLNEPSDFDNRVVEIVGGCFNDNFIDMKQSLIEDYVVRLRTRERVLYAIALECFNELCAGMAPESIRKRLDGAIENVIKEQA